MIRWFSLRSAAGSFPLSLQDTISRLYSGNTAEVYDTRLAADRNPDKSVPEPFVT